MDAGADPAVEGHRSRSDAVQRHSGDVLRLVLGASVVAVTTLFALEEQLRAVERNSFNLVNQLPDVFRTFFDGVQQAGAFPAVLVVAGAVLLLRRSRLAASVAAAGTGAWLAAKVLKEMVGRPRPFLIFPDAVVRGPLADGLGFPSGHSAVAAALAGVITPYLPRWARRAVWCLVLLVAVARVYVGAHLPLDVVGGLALGWAVGAAVNLLTGAPRWEVDPGALVSLFARHGLAVAAVRPAGPAGAGSTAYVVRTGTGDKILARIVSHEDRDADVLFRIWRHLVYRGPGDDAPFLPARRIVEHEAYLLLMAERIGVSAPRLVLAGPVAGEVSVLGEEVVDGRPIGEHPPEAVSDQVLAAFWRELAKLRCGRVAHRHIRPSSLLLDGSGAVTVVGFGHAESEASDRALDRDVVQMLAALATVAGGPRAVDAGVGVLGTAPFEPALDLLEPQVIPEETRTACGGVERFLGGLRDVVAARTGQDRPSPEALPAIPAWMPVTVGLLGLGLYLGLPRLSVFGSTGDVLSTVRWDWALVAVAAVVLSQVAAAGRLLAVAPERLSPARTLGCGLAASFAARLTPSGTGAAAVLTRYLQRSGLGPAAAPTVAATTVTDLAVRSLGLLLAAGIVVARAGGVARPPGWALAAGAAVVGVATGFLVRASPGRRRAMVGGRGAMGALAEVAGRPARLIALVTGAVAATGLCIVAFDSSLRAVGLELQFATVALVYLAARTVSEPIPLPGGLVVTDLALVAGATGFGAGAGAALAGVLGFRLLTFWLPLAPGRVALVRLRRHSLL